MVDTRERQMGIANRHENTGIAWGTSDCGENAMCALSHNSGRCEGKKDGEKKIQAKSNFFVQIFFPSLPVTAAAATARLVCVCVCVCTCVCLWKTAVAALSPGGAPYRKRKRDDRRQLQHNTLPRPSHRYSSQQAIVAQQGRACRSGLAVSPSPHQGDCTTTYQPDILSINQPTPC
ncbi:hypothetical protein ACI65C_004196 [Semiaphis heraclei]